MTKTQAAQVTSLGEAFKGSNIVTFEELEWFTGLDSVGSAAFNGCSRLTSLKVPETINGFCIQSVSSCPNLERLEVLGGKVTAAGNAGTDAGYNHLSSFTVVLRPDVTIPGSYALAFKCCKHIEFWHQTAPALASDAFGQSSGSYLGCWATPSGSGSIIYVPTGATGYAGGEWNKICKAGGYWAHATISATL